METGSLDFLLNNQSLWQFKLEIYKYCKIFLSKDQEQSVLYELSKDINNIKTMTIHQLSQSLIQHLIDRPQDLKGIAISVRRFIPEVIMIALDSNIEQLTSGNPQRVINLNKILSTLLGLYTSIKDQVYLFFKKQKDQFRYSPLVHLEELLKESGSSESLNILFESLVRFLFFDFRLFKEIWGLKLDFDIKALSHLDQNVRFGYITLLKNMLGLSTDQTYSLFETLFAVSSDSQEFYALMKEFDEYGERIYREVLDIKSHFLCGKDENETEADIDDEDLDDVMQGSCKRVNSGSDSSFINNSLVVLDNQKRTLQELWKKLTLNDFLILNGSSGTGKSSYLSILQKKMNKSSITLFMDAQTDFKSMLGNYTCSEKIGEFEWKKGPLASAMENGLWLILENFQEANEELINSLTTCIQTGQVRLQSVGQTVHSAIGFKVIAVTDVKFTKHDQTISSSLMNLYETAAIVDLNETFNPTQFKEVFLYLFGKYSKNVNDDLVYQMFAQIYDGIICDQALNESLNHQQKKALSLNLRSFTVLLRRFWHQIKNIYGESGLNSSTYSTENFRKYLFLETLDCIFYKVKDIRAYDVLLTKIAEIFQLSFEELMTFVENYSPEIELKGNRIKLGRVGVVPIDIFCEKSENQQGTNLSKSSHNIIYNAYTKRIIEKIAGCLIHDESCLLVGDTGCGKTTIAQHVAEIFGKNLHVYNLSQGSDAIDLIGGYKPVDMKTLIKKILQKYLKNLIRVASEKSNKKFIENLQNLCANREFAKLLLCMIESFKMLKQKINTKYQGQEKEKVLKKWEKLETRVNNIYRNKDKIETNLVFDFMEGNLIKAIKEGDWILIDEINLASNELLQKLLPIIEGNSIILFEKGDLKEIKRHKNFRIIACMNPGSDIGKKELPENIRVKFTEFFINDLEDRADLLYLVDRALNSMFTHEIKEKVVDLYIWLRRSSENYELEDGYNKRPHFSLRNISRAMTYMNKTVQIYGLLRAIFEGVFIGFGSILSTKSQQTLQNQIEKMFGFTQANYMKAVQQINKLMPGYLNIYGFYIKQGPFPLKKMEETDFEVTPTFEKYLIELMRIVSNTNYAVLLEGPTSSGKTSIIKFIAEITGNKCVRVNNHHHTDIEEYIGTYMPNSKGKLVFQEGILVEAVKKGYWIILDELNLARSEILESLNRLLDENKELFIPEQQMHIKPHENFKLFATQNPIHYSGRKELSKAFKNRFIQIYFDEISEADLEKIILKRCKIAPSFCKKLLAVMKDLQIRRQTNNFFMGKEAAITVRDLIKWAKRPFISSEELAIEGYSILAERLRTDEDRMEVKKIIEKAFKCTIDPGRYYLQYTESPEFVESRRKLDEFLANKSNYSGIQTVQWNASFRRMATLVDKCLKNQEPVLLIGETGCGKTTICQLMSILYNVPFYSINCHHYTESMDFLGSLRPLRNREEYQINLDLKRTILLQHLNENLTAESVELAQLIEKDMATDLKVQKITKILEKLSTLDQPAKLIVDYLVALGKSESLFEWQDGPLTQAMRHGGIFLIDEISLADDSVLERMNSVLESERTLTLSEKTDEIDMIKANDNFFILATMNPGGDFGKRELSPALRNRFTEVWVEPITARHYLNYHYAEILTDINQHNLTYGEIFARYGNDCLNMLAENIEKNNHLNVTFTGEELDIPALEVKFELAYVIFRFLHYFNFEFCEKYLNEKKYLSLRDILTLIHFMEKRLGFPINSAYSDGLAVMILDSIGMHFSNQQRTMVMKEINDKVHEIVRSTMYLTHDHYILKKPEMMLESIPDTYTFETFSVPIIKSKKSHTIRFSTNSRTVNENLRKVMRALQIGKAVMLEGSPGVGKSSLVEYIANQTGHKLLKINLSEQTDLMDLLGCDVPKGQDQNFAQDSKLEFAWADGLLLKALKKGYWIILNELNLANQTVLEGLNACLDHRGSVFIPELNKEFVRHPNFRIFATQNPIQKGGGRKSLPSSFLNRFSKVYIEEYQEDDFYNIVESLYPQIERTVLQNLVRYNSTIKQEIMKTSPEESWEFNLRDILRVCDMLSQGLYLQESIELIYLKRLKKLKALEVCISAYEQIFETQFSTTEFFDIPLFISSRNILEVKYLVSSGERKTISCPKNVQAQPKPHKNLLRAQVELNFSKYYLKDIIKVLPFKWPVLVSGPKGCGKSTLIKNLGEFLNKKVITIHLNASTDSSDLIGNYDQEDIHRRVQEFVQRFDTWINDVILTYLYSKRNLDYLSLINTLQGLRFNVNQSSGVESLNIVIGITEILEKSVVELSSQEDISKDLTNYRIGAQKYSSLLSDQKKKASWFNWFNSELISAVIKGEWVVLENIGGCNSAILERLNPLLECDQKFYINECSSFDGKNLKIKPHDNFRIFMIISGGNDKISSALLNRCVEINMSRGTMSEDILRSEAAIQDKENDMVVEDPVKEKETKELSKVQTASTFEEKYQKFWFKATVGDMQKLIEMEGIFSKDVQKLIISTVLSSYSLVSKVTGAKAIPFEMNSFAKMLKKYKENREFDMERKASFEKAYLESFRPFFRHYNEAPEHALTIMNKQEQLNPINYKNALNNNKAILQELETQVLDRLNPSLERQTYTLEEEAKVNKSFWMLSGLSLEDSIDYNLLRIIDIQYNKIFNENSKSNNLINLNALKVKVSSIIERGTYLASYLMGVLGLNLEDLSMANINQCICIFLIHSLSNTILELSLSIKGKLRPTDAAILQEILNLADSVKEILRSKTLSTDNVTDSAIKKIIQVFYLISQKHHVIMKSFTYAGPVLKEILLKEINLLNKNQIKSDEPKDRENEEKAMRLELISHKPNLVALLPKKPEFYLFVQKVLYLNDKDSTKYNRILGNYREDFQINQKLNSVLLVDEKFTSSFFKLFGNIIFSLNSIPTNKEEAYQKILDRTFEGLMPKIQEAFAEYETKKSQVYLDIEEEYNRNVLKSIPVLTDDYAVQLDMKLNAEKSRFILIHEYLFLQTLENICQVLMTHYSLSAHPENSFRKEYQRIFDNEDLKINILDTNLSGDFKLYLYYLFEKNEFTSEMLLEFKTRVYVEHLLWEKRCSEVNVNKEDLTYFVFRGMEEIEVNGTLKSFFVSSHVAKDIFSLLKSQIRLKKENSCGDIFFVILWLFKSFWGDNKEILKELRKLLAIANNLNTINSKLGQEELKNAHELFDRSIRELRENQKEDVESTVMVQIQDEVLELLKLIIGYASTGAKNMSKCVKMSIGWKLWNLFNIFETESSRTFSRRLFKSKLRLDLLKEGQSLLELKMAGTILHQIEEMRFFNTDSNEYQALVNELGQLEEKLAKRKKEYIVRCSDLENPFEIFDDFLSTNIKYISQIHRFFADVTEFTLTPDKVREAQNVINNWVMISNQGYFLNFKDILVPLYYACDLINKGCHEMMRHGKKDDTLSLYSSTTIDDQMALHGKVVDILGILQSASACLQTSDVASLFGTFYDVLKYQTVNSKEDLTSSIVVFSLEALGRGLKQKEDTDDSDPATKWIKLNKRFQEAIIDEYSKEGVQHNKEREAEEIEERFDKKEAAETIQTLISLQTNVKDVVAHLNSMNEFTKTNRLKVNLEDLILKIIRFKSPENLQNKTIKLIKGILEVTSYSRAQNKDLINLQGLEMLGYYLARKNQNLSSTQEAYNFYSNENPDELCKLYFVSQKLLEKVSRFLKETIFFSHPTLQNIALIIDHYLTLFLNYTPLTKILPFLSHLIQKLDEWNINVPRDFKIIEEYEELLKIVLHWRKLERDSWKDLIEESQRKFERKDLVYIMDIWNTAINSKPEATEFFSMLEPFIKTTQFGTYAIRLEVIKLLRDVCKSGNRQGHVDACSSVIKHLEYFREYYLNKKDEVIKQLQKDIQKYVDLSRWDAKDHAALKYSTEKYHRKLNKILKKFEEFLEFPIEKVLMEPVRKNYLQESVNHFITVHENDFVTKGNSKKSKPVDLGKIKAMLANPLFEVPEHQKQVYNNLVNFVLQSMEVVPEKYYAQIVSDANKQPIKASNIRTKDKTKTKHRKKKTDEKENANDAEEEGSEIKALCDYLKVNAVGFFDRIKSLREENTLRTLKTKAFVDFLKFLKDLGIKEMTFKTDVEENLIDAINEDLEEVLGKLNNCGCYNPVQKKLSKMKKYEDKIIDYLAVIERNKQFHPDLGTEAIVRAENYCKSLWTYSLRMRKKLSMIFKELQRFYKTYHSLAYAFSISANEQIIFTLESGKEFHNIHSLATENVSYLKMMFQTFDSCGMSLDEKVLVNLRELITALSNVKEFLTKFVEKDLCKISSADLDNLPLIINQILIKAHDIKSLTCNQNKIEYASDFVVYNQMDLIGTQWTKVINWTNGLLSSKIQTVSSSHENLTLNLEDATKSLLLFSQNKLKSTQKYINTIGKFVYEDEESKEDGKETQYRKCNDLTENEVKNISKDTKILENFNEKLTTYLLNQEVFKVNVNNQQFLNLLNLAKKSIDSQLLEHVRSVKMIEKFCYLTFTIMYNLFYKGFCLPQKGENGNKEGEDEGEGEFQVGTGTGIGEGEGMQNVSKEIEYEEQVLGEKGGEGPKDEEKEYEKEDQGVEMENDFEGKNYDQEQGQGDDEEEKDDNKDDADDEFSSVENELDYKLWHDDEEDKDQNNDQEDQNQEEEGKDPLRKEEKLDFHDKMEMDNSTQRAKEEEKPKDKSDKRNIKDYDEFEDKREQDEMKSEGKEENEDEYMEVEKEPEHQGKEKEEAQDEEGSNLEKMDEDNAQKEEGKEGENQEEEKLSFASEEPAGEDDNQQPEEGDGEENREKMDEENIENKENADDLEQEKEGQGEENNEEEEKQEKQQFDSTKQQMQDKKIPVGKGPKNQASAMQNQEENEKEKEGDTTEQMEDEKKGNNNISKSQQVTELKENVSDLLKKFVQNFEKKEVLDLENFIKDLNISGENNPEEMEKQRPPPTTGMQQFEAPENYDYEIFDPSGEADTSKMMKTNAPSSDLKHEIQRPAKNEANQASNKESNENETQTVFLDEEEQKKEENENEQPENFDAPKTKKKQQQQEKEKEPLSQQNVNTKELIEKAQEKFLKSIKEEAMQLDEENIQESNTEKKKLLKEEKRMQVEDVKDDEIVYDNAVSHAEMKENLQQLISEWKSDSLNQEKGFQIWNKFENATRHQAMALCEELKAVLQPTEIASLKGDYKSGKRLNMKKIIPYIASNYRKDKIWLRRADPSKRKFQIMLAIDDSLSMSAQNVGFIALESLTVLALAMSKLEVGQIAISQIEDGLKLLHPFDSPLTSAEGPYILSQFNFQYQDMMSSDLSLAKFMRSSIDLFKEWKVKEKASQQICFIVSDGRFNKNLIKPLMKEAEENGQCYIFVILDNKDEKKSILNIRSTQSYYENGNLKINIFNYMDDFPFKYYLVVKDISTLARSLVDILRQYFERNE